MPIRKRSRKRDAIYDCLRATASHPSAEWVYAQLKPCIPDLSLATVYRNLREFRREGRVISVGVVGGFERFDACTEPHAHFVCRRCDAVLDVEQLLPPSELCQSISCGRADGCELLFYGVCNECIACDAS